MNFIEGMFKFKGMKKPGEFLIYPCQAHDTVIKLQSQTRMVIVDLKTDKAWVSLYKSNGACSLDATPDRGAIQVTLLSAQIELIKSMRDRVSKITDSQGRVAVVTSINAANRNLTVSIPEDFKKEG